ncbi:adenylate/guanylate cyclase domain-containing protein [Candidatus Marinimicrobia bacterium]|nr:adenylate/guanylate cyclase domain-containing protein [Candidatus Neomarinimicrobiota bacterium]
MTNQKISTKKLKAIVFTDIVDFTKISAEDEQQALGIINKQRELLKPIVIEHNGEWLKEIGDGLLFSFDSSLDAVKCSIKIQEAVRDVDDFKLRIGIHQGDIFIQDGDVYGDDVNIASRVEGFAPEGGIAISDKIGKDIAGVKEIKVVFLGHKKMKGVDQDIKVYCINHDDLNVFKRQLFPLIIGWFLILLGGIGGLTTIIVYSLGFTSSEEFIALRGEVGWGAFGKGMIRHFSFFIFGYTNLMYVSGVSSKTHKYVVYASYVVLLIFIATIIGNTIEGNFK